jgi:hypothetical protein
MKIAAYERASLEEIVGHCLRTGGAASMEVAINRLSFLGYALAGIKRRAAEESLFTLPVEDPFYGYGELAQLAWRVQLPPEPDITKLPADESKAEYKRWSQITKGTLEVYWADEIQATVAMHLFRATAHHIQVRHGKYSVFHSEKWRLRKKTATPDTRLRLDPVYIRRWVEGGIPVGVECGPYTAGEIKLASSLDTL